MCYRGSGDSSYDDEADGPYKAMDEESTRENSPENTEMAAPAEQFCY